MKAIPQVLGIAFSIACCFFTICEKSGMMITDMRDYAGGNYLWNVQPIFLRKDSRK